MSKPLRVLLVAEESAGIQTLRALAAGPHEIVAVMASESRSGEGISSVWNVARGMGVPLWPAEEVRNPDLAHKVTAAGTDVILNVHSLYVIHEQVLNAASMGAFNLHPGPLPEYAGLNAPSWAIYHDRKEHAVTVHRMEPGIDTGAVVFENRFAISGRDTGLSIAMRCIKEGVPLVLRLLDALAEDPSDLPERGQDLEKRKYFGKSQPQQGKIDWARSAREIHNFVRASDYAPFTSPWGYPATYYADRVVRLSRTALTDHSCDKQPGMIALDGSGDIIVACADAWLIVRKLIVDGKHYRAVEFLIPGTAFNPQPGAS